MRTTSALLLALLATACATPEGLPRAPLVPPVAIEKPVIKSERVRADSDRSPPTAIDQPASPRDPQSITGVAPPNYRTIVETVEVPVEVEIPVDVRMPRRRIAGDGRGYYYEPNYDDYVRYRRSGRRWRPSGFPVNTAIGAGVGAIIGHQRGRRDRGALIGGGIGLLMDLNRWSR